MRAPSRMNRRPVPYAFFVNVVCDRKAWTHDLHNSKVPFLTLFSLVVTFGHLSVKPNEFIFVPNSTLMVNLVRFSQAVCKISHSQIFSIWSLTHGQPHNQMPSVDNRQGDYQNCSLLCCILKLCTVINTLRWAVLTVLWISFCHTGPISLCVDLFVFIVVYFVCFCFILHSCCNIVSTVGWTWWDWSLIPWTYLPSVLWHCWLGHLTRKNPSPIWPIMCLVGR